MRYRGDEWFSALVFLLSAAVIWQLAKLVEGSVLLF